MEPKKRQNGSTLLLVGIVLVLVVIGYMVSRPGGGRQAPEPIEPSTSPTIQPTISETGHICTRHEKICFDYPSSWSAAYHSVKKDGRTNVLADTLVFKNFASVGVLQVESNVVPEVKRPCEPRRAGTLITVESKPTELKGYDNPDSDRDTNTLHAVKAIFQPTKNQFYPVIYLTNQKDQTAPGRTTDCSLDLRAVFPSKGLGDDSGSTSYGFVSVSNRPFSEAYPSEQAAMTALGGNDMIIAYDIMKSASYDEE